MEGYLVGLHSPAFFRRYGQGVRLLPQLCQLPAYGQGSNQRQLTSLTVLAGAALSWSEKVAVEPSLTVTALALTTRVGNPPPPLLLTVHVSLA